MSAEIRACIETDAEGNAAGKEGGSSVSLAISPSGMGCRLVGERSGVAPFSYLAGLLRLSFTVRAASTSPRIIKPMKNLRPEATGILECVELLSGRPVQFKPESSLILRATLRTARDGAEAHVLHYRPSNELLDYWVAFQAGYLLRMFELPQDQRSDFEGTGQGLEQVSPRCSICSHPAASAGAPDGCRPGTHPRAGQHGRVSRPGSGAWGARTPAGPRASAHPYGAAPATGTPPVPAPGAGCRRTPGAARHPQQRALCRHRTGRGARQAAGRGPLPRLGAHHVPAAGGQWCQPRAASPAHPPTRPMPSPNCWPAHPTRSGPGTSTLLKGPAKWTCFHLYVILDIFSRFVVGWLIAPRECAELA